MTIDFWKYVKQRWDYLNMKMNYVFWVVILLRIFAIEWLESKWVWWGYMLNMTHHFIALCIITGVTLGMTALWKLSRHRKRENRRQYEEIQAELEERRRQQTEQHERWVARQREARGL
jgi:hypothetical protein